MWPWGHVALAYLLFTGWHRVHGRRPSDAATVALGVGALLPDLVDKPLHWWAGLLPTGRTLAHSALVLGAVTALLLAVGRRRDWPHVRPFLAGWWAHLLGDALPTLLADGPSYLTFLAWPLLASPVYPEGPQLVLVDPLFVAEAALTLLALVVWVRDGAPGLGLIRRSARRVRRR